MDRLASLKNLVVMAMADGTLSEHELTLLCDRCSELGLNEDELREAVQFALSKEASLELPTIECEQEAMLTDLIRMMAADGELNEVEKQLFALAAAKMNYAGDRLNQLIDRLLRSDSSQTDM